MSFISSLLLMTTLLSEFVGGVIAKDIGVNNMVEMAIARVGKLFFADFISLTFILEN
ncbi:hypothetical protein [Escherichia coli]|uniref:hypothetical protein n=1 Tax=Escherichia coli TaxID=562 RepID=UPI003B975376